MRLGALCIALATAVTSLGCGAPCQNAISAQRLVRDAKIGSSDGNPHAQLRLPHHRLNLLLASLLVGQEISAELALPAALPFPALRAVANRIEIRNAENGSLAFDVGVELKLGDTRLMSLSATVEARTQTRSEDGRSVLEIGFDADSLRSVTPKIPSSALEAMSKVVGPAIKLTTGKEIPGPLLKPVTAQLISHVSNKAFAVIRDQVLARLGEVARLRIDMGRTPLERAETRAAKSPQAALVIDIFMALPVHVGLAPEPTTPEPVSGTGRLRISGDALAELGNWSIAEGIAPQSYDSKLRPDPDGSYVPVYQWRGGPNPLVVHTFRVRTPCSTIIASAKPEVSVADGEVVVSITDGNVESVEGSALVRMGVGLKNLFGDGISKASSGPAGASFEIGGRSMDARLTHASLGSDELELTVELSLPKG